MKKTISFLFIAAIIAITGNINAQTTVIDTDFDDYSVGNLDGQTLWDGDDATVVTTADYVKTGTNGVQLGTGADIHYEAYDKTTTGLSGTVYMDTWIKMTAAPGDGYFQITQRDLTPDGSGKRIAMFEFNADLEIRAYNGSSKTVIGSYAVGDWVRVSFCVDYGALTYDVAVNGTVELEGLDFRESYDATEKGRATDTKEFHSIRFLNDDDLNLATAALGSVYVGEDAISDIDFPAPSTERTITVNQPANATITLSPLATDNIYELGTQVSSTISGVADHYIFNGWTGGLSGTTNPIEFTVESSMSIGAEIIVDPNDPPASYTVGLTQSTGGTITVDPVQASYYEGTELTFEATPEIGYEFTSWSGIDGTTSKEKVTIGDDLTVSAVFTKGTFTNRIVNVSTTSELEDALDDMLPGDSIILADGTYSGAGAGLTALGGNASYPVVVSAANIGGASITGDGYFSLTNCAYITFKGISFDVSVYTLFKLTDCNNIRLTQNTFKNSGNGGSKLILIGGDWDGTSCASNNNRIDYNLFDGKTDGGAWVVLDGTHGGTPQVSQYDRIDHNHFRFNQTRASNEKETIRIGMSDLSLSSAFCTVEDNLFEECDGDPEIISVKSCDNYVRNNTFIKCLGTVSLRHGDRTEVSGNYFLGQGKTAEYTNDDNETSTIGCGGVRVYGKDHTVFNNYFEDLTGYKWDAALTITQGDATNSGVTNSSDLTKHYIAENLEFTHNTIVNCFSGIEIGYTNSGNYSKSVVNCLVANNIIVQDSNQVTTVYETGNDVNFESNIIYTSGTATWGDITFTDAEATNVDPKLELTNGRVPGDETNTVPVYTYKLTSESTDAIDATTANTFDYITVDADGQAIINSVRDLGADEYNTENPAVSGALNENYVGPYAITFKESSAIEYTITITETTGGTVTVSPASGPYYSGQSITFTATADSNFLFSSWATGLTGTTNPETVMLSSDLTVSADFAADTTGPGTAINDEGSIELIKAYPNPFELSTTIVVNGTADVAIYSATGQLVDRFEVIESTEWTAPKAGMYFGVVTSATGSSHVKLIAQ